MIGKNITVVASEGRGCSGMMHDVCSSFYRVLHIRHILTKVSNCNKFVFGIVEVLLYRCNGNLLCSLGSDASLLRYTENFPSFDHSQRCAVLRIGIVSPSVLKGGKCNYVEE